MNTKICFVLLLAIGISTQISEFEIDFDNTVNSVKLKDGRTLLVSTTFHLPNESLKTFKNRTYERLSDILSLKFTGLPGGLR